MGEGIDGKEFMNAAGKLGKESKRGANQSLVDSLACQIVGLLTDVPTQDLRRKAVDKARRMLGIR